MVHDALECRSLALLTNLKCIALQARHPLHDDILDTLRPSVAVPSHTPALLDDVDPKVASTDAGVKVRHVLLDFARAFCHADAMTETMDEGWARKLATDLVIRLDDDAWEDDLYLSFCQDLDLPAY